MGKEKNTMERKKVRIYSFTKTGGYLAEELCEKLNAAGYVCEGYTVSRFAEHCGVKELTKGWKEELGTVWGSEALVFIGAAGIAVRTVAPFVKDKFTDSAVIVLDETGEFVIPLLSGHVGGAVELASRLADYTGGTAVITTATDVQKKFAVDVFAKENGLILTSREHAKKISAGILEKEKTGIFSEFPVSGDIPQELTLCKNEEELETCRGKIVICTRMPEKEIPGALYLLPRSLYVGMGCRKGSAGNILSRELSNILRQHGFLPQQICAIGSIDLKKEEPGLLELAESLGVGFCTFSAEELKKISTVSASSEFVRRITGVDNVCERAAKKMCPNGQLVQEKICLDQCTIAIVCRECVIKFGKKEGVQ